jgi:hypothetical protein
MLIRSILLPRIEIAIRRRRKIEKLNGRVAITKDSKIRRHELYYVLVATQIIDFQLLSSFIDST